MNFAYPTLEALSISKKWGVVDARIYPAPTHRHTGLDIFGATGSPIYAAADGMVKDVMVNLHGYGRAVQIQHADGAFDTLYAHLLEDIRVAVGDEVTAGQQIGRMGGDPRDADPVDGVSSNPHLHFEVIYPTQPAGGVDTVQHWGGYTVDPMNALARLKYGEPKSFATVLAPKGVYIHPEMSADSPRLGDGLQYRQTYPILDYHEVGLNIWVKLWAIRDEYAAAIYGGDILLSVSMNASANPPIAVPVQTGLDEKAIRLDEIQRMIDYLEERKAAL